MMVTHPDVFFSDTDGTTSVTTDGTVSVATDGTVSVATDGVEITGITDAFTFCFFTLGGVGTTGTSVWTSDSVSESESVSESDSAAGWMACFNSWYNVVWYEMIFE